MSNYAEMLYGLLPAIYRVRDAQQGEMLRALLDIIAEQAEVMNADIARLYDNLFIETCDEWVVPYIGDLLGVRGLYPVSGVTFSQRARVANTLSYRRRKGTAAMLEQLSQDTTGWRASVVEFFQHLGATQHVNHRRPQNHRTPDLRDANALELVGTPFDATARTADVRRIASGRGRHNLPNVGIFLWHLQFYPVRRAPAFDHGGKRYSFSPLGHDAPLFNPAATETDIAHLARERNVPGRLRRRALYGELEARRQAWADKREPRPIWFGAEPVLQVFLDGSPRPVPPEEILICHLGAWTVPPDGKTYRCVAPNGSLETVPCLITVAVDPELGRLTFPGSVTPSAVRVTYAYGFGGDLGGGSYGRPQAPLLSEAREYLVGPSEQWMTLQDALDGWASAGRPSALFRIRDSEFHDVDADLLVPAGRALEIRADLNDGLVQRPVLRLKSALKIAAEPPPDDRTPLATAALDGLWLTGNQVQVPAGDLGALTLRHCTLVPGWALKPDGSPTDPGQPSMSVATGNGRLQVTLERSIAGKLQLAAAQSLAVRDSIIAAKGDVAIAGPTVTVERSTVLGSVTARKVALASDSIFTGVVAADRTQEGCVRFSYLPQGSAVPRRFRCQPGLAIRQAEEAASARGGSLTSDEGQAIATRMQPVFTSDEYGTPEFCLLHPRGPREISAGADSGLEMGAFHHLKKPQREANLRASLDEYLRAGLETGIFCADQIDSRPKDQP